MRRLRKLPFGRPCAGLALLLTCAAGRGEPPPSPRDELYPYARGERVVVADNLDRYNLFKRRLFDRQLFEQLAQPGQRYRLGRKWETVAFAVDGSVATTQVLDGEFTRYHGYFLFDTFAALRSPYGVDFNLNLTLTNPSSSDGVRVSSAALPDGSLHFYQDLNWGGQKGRLDLMGIDLGTTTLGNGLILEQWPVEGAFGNLALGDFYLRHYFAGRVFWDDDDLFTLQAGALGGNVELMLLGWKFTRHDPSVAWYLDASYKLPLLDERFQFSAEYAANLRARPRHGLLLRGDTRDQFAGTRWHLGYQFRWYQRGFGPLRDLEAPSTNFNLPYREEQYANNSFEYFGVSELYEQWSHGVMAELEVPLGCFFQLFGQGEVIAGYARDDAGSAQLVRLPRGRVLPGAWLDGYYRAGLRHYPWRDMPHRLSMWFSNKQVMSPMSFSEATDVLYQTNGHWVSLQLEAFL